MEDTFEESIRDFIGGTNNIHCLSGERQRNKSISHVLSQVNTKNDQIMDVGENAPRRMEFCNYKLFSQSYVLFRY